MPARRRRRPREISAGSWAASMRRGACPRAVSRWSSNGRSSATASRTGRRTSWRSGTARRIASASRSSRPGGSDWISVNPRQFVENHRLPSGTTLSIYNELYHPTNGANYIAVYLSPNLDAGNFRGIEAGVWKVRLIGEEVRDGRFNAWIERDDPGGARAGRRPPCLSLSVVLHRAKPHRLALDQLARVRSSRHRGGESGRCAAADQCEQQPGTDARRPLQTRDCRARHERRCRQRLRASRRALDLR